MEKITFDREILENLAGNKDMLLACVLAAIADAGAGVKINAVLWPHLVPPARVGGVARALVKKGVLAPALGRGPGWYRVQTQLTANEQEAAGQATEQRPSSDAPATTHEPASAVEIKTSEQPAPTQRATSDRPATGQQGGYFSSQPPEEEKGPVTSQQPGRDNPATGQRTTSDNPATTQRPTSDSPAAAREAASAVRIETSDELATGQRPGSDPAAPTQRQTSADPAPTQRGGFFSRQPLEPEEEEGEDERIEAKARELARQAWEGVDARTHEACRGRFETFWMYRRHHFLEEAACK